jgi:hypothetical protein
MLFLLCQIGDGRYSIDAKRVLEVLPFLNLMPVPQALPGLAGLFTYRGKPVPVVDLSCLLLGRPAQARLSTRLVLTRCDEDSQACLPDGRRERSVANRLNSFRPMFPAGARPGLARSARIATASSSGSTWENCGQG